MQEKVQGEKDKEKNEEKKEEEENVADSRGHRCKESNAMDGE